MRILVTICARAGSKGVKSKNMRDYLGSPICYYTLAALDLFRQRHGAEFDGITLAVNTDAADLFAQIDKTTMDYVPVPREEALATDTASKIDVIRDTLRRAQAATGQTFDVVVDMDLTSPLRKPSDIAGVVNTLLADDNADVAMSVTEARRNPYFNQLTVDADGYMHTAIASNFVARQQAPTVVDANASLYAYRPSYLRNNDGVLLHGRVKGWEMEDTAVLDIDSERDFMLLTALADIFYRSDEAFNVVHTNIQNILKR